jgi:iron complex outermembrane receptor protein
MTHLIATRAEGERLLAAFARRMGRRYANDINTLSADPFESVALRTGYSKSFASSNFQVFARIDNFFDREYVGSVIVNNASPFEPSPLRNWMVGVKGQARF